MLRIVTQCAMSVTGESLIDDDDVSLLEEEDDLQSTADSDTLQSGRSARGRAGLSGRGVTLPMLMKEGFLEPGEGAMTIDYLGQKFRGDLLPDGQIRSHETAETFASPSAWAIHCKKIVNPDKKSGCGWASVKYRGKKLDIYKNMLFKKRREREREQGEQEEECESVSACEDEKKDLLMKKRAMLQKIIVKHEALGIRNSDHDPSTLLECVPFSELGKIQPFTVTVASSTALTVVGFHSHLTDSEVVGYLAGRWDVNTHDLAITHAFPVRCRLGEKSKWKRVEYDVYTAIEERKLTLVGWYHSHPHSPPTPTIRDSDLQLDYQLKMKGSSDASYTPCVGMIYTPFPKNKKRPLQSNLLCYWVMPPHEMRPHDYPRPMAMEYSVVRDSYIHQDALTEMRLCAEFYRGAPDAVNFTRPLADGSTNWERLKSALEPCVPAKHSAQIIEFFHDLLFPRPGSGCPEAKVVQSTAALLAARCSDPSLVELAAHHRSRDAPPLPPAPPAKRARTDTAGEGAVDLSAARRPAEVVELDGPDLDGPQDLSAARPAPPAGEEEEAPMDMSAEVPQDLTAGVARQPEPAAVQAEDLTSPSKHADHTQPEGEEHTDPAAGEGQPEDLSAPAPAEDDDAAPPASDPASPGGSDGGAVDASAAAGSPQETEDLSAPHADSPQDLRAAGPPSPAAAPAPQDNSDDEERGMVIDESAEPM
ncbi:MPN domain-containing protein [Amphibalanus amphitrite]|uniref:MPN domain-containing protein n=1 Tax=Amphibalanus amphitrite TaxID=1232801 RepID=A0A6A4VMN7_AMPAM|nr:MPN domain-containing protein [Amphibalanus amphitrite]